MIQYLILHKVRGKPAFDIAHKLEFEPDDPRFDEDWWIVSTSGHRAYPSWQKPLYECIETHPQQEDWDYLPDHYQVSKRLPDRIVEVGSSLLDRLGLVKKIERRI